MTGPIDGTATQKNDRVAQTRLKRVVFWRVGDGAVKRKRHPKALAQWEELVANTIDFGDETIAFCHALRAFSATDDGYCRLAFTAEHRHAADWIKQRMRQAGLAVREDAAGNVIGRLEGPPGAKTLLIGSHQDTVRDAGSYDGMLGIAAAVLALHHFHATRTQLPFALEAYAFTDEEGTRFQSTFLGSEMVAGCFDPTHLHRPDADGLTVADAMRGFGLNPDAINDARRDPAAIRGYLEVHIEQGPVLQAEDLAVCAVTGIAGQTRLWTVLTGTAGHAGTVPMHLRRDALAGAAEAIAALNTGFANRTDLVATVGLLEVKPGATNVIPGEAAFSLDIRSADDRVRQAAVADAEGVIRDIAAARGLGHRIERTHDTAATPCDSDLIAAIRAACKAVTGQARALPSGAGHDAVAMAGMCPTGMIFVRCKDGISHNPAESITAADADAGVRALIKTIEILAATDEGATA